MFRPVLHWLGILAWLLLSYIAQGYRQVDMHLHVISCRQMRGQCCDSHYRQHRAVETSDMPQNDIELAYEYMPKARKDKMECATHAL